MSKKQNAQALLSSLSAETLAELAVLIDQANSDRADFVTVNRLATLAYNLGQGKAGAESFTTLYFDAVIDHGA